MHGTISNGFNNVAGSSFSSHLPGGDAPTLMNPVNDTMNPLCTMITREQKGGMLNHQNNLADQMITALQGKQEGPIHVDLGGKDIRLGDLSAQFDPKMDQENHLHTGRGDGMMIIV